MYKYKIIIAVIPIIIIISNVLLLLYNKTNIANNNLNVERTFKKYAQYNFLLSPDFSTYTDMNLWRQLESVAKNRWVGAYWQDNGLTVIPTISWSTPRSFDFCLFCMLFSRFAPFL